MLPGDVAPAVPPVEACGELVDATFDELVERPRGEEEELPAPNVDELDEELEDATVEEPPEELGDKALVDWEAEPEEEEELPAPVVEELGGEPAEPDVERPEVRELVAGDVEELLDWDAEGLADVDDTAGDAVDD